MTWLVTGATGRIGTALVERLAGLVPLALLVRGRSASGATALERATRAFAGGPAGAAIADGTIRIVEGNLERPDFGLSAAARARVVAETTGVLHLGALTDFTSPDDDRHALVNLGGALAAADLAEAARAPLHFISTAYVSGDHAGTFREDELDVGQAHHNPYERSKAAAERALVERARKSGLPLAILRLGVVLPDAPRAGLATGPGPLVYLEFLAGLEGRKGGRERTLRHPGRADSLLNLVRLDDAVDVIAAAVARGGDCRGTYHVTAREPTAIGTIAELVNEQIAGLSIELSPARTLADADRVERVLERHCRMYQPYLFLATRHDRTRLEREFAPFDGPDRSALRTIFAAHVEAFRAARDRTTRTSPDVALGRRVKEYFDTFLPLRTGRRLVPGLESLTAEFTVSVPRVGIHRLAIERGVLLSVARTDRPSPEIDYASDAETLLLAVAGRAHPAQLFFDRRVTIRGDLARALSTAIALEEFFRLHPFVAA